MHHVMSPMEFMQRLAALVPRPRLHLIRFHGVLAPSAKWRSKVVLQASEDSKSLTATAAATDSQEQPEHGRPMRLGWAKLLKRVFNLDLTHCSHCGGDLIMIAAIMQREAPKNSGCEGGCLECEKAQIDADFQRYFCASNAHSPKETSQ
jgi:Putative transposase